MIGLASDKKVVLLNGQGGDYSNQEEPMEMATKLVRTNL